MPAIDFPNSPSVNDTHTVGNRVWKWNGTVWEVVRSTVPYATGATGPGTVWTDWFYYLGGQYIPAENFPVDGKLTLQCEEVASISTYRLMMEMGDSPLETVIATVSKIGVQDSSTTYVLENSGVFQVGGDRTTPDVWDIRVFDSNNPFDSLTSHYIIRVLLSPTLCGVDVWKTPVDLTLT